MFCRATMAGFRDATSAVTAICRWEGIHQFSHRHAWRGLIPEGLSPGQIKKIHEVVLVQ